MVIESLKGVIPTIIAKCNLYKSTGEDAEQFLGITGEINLPELSNMTETINGPGILGEVEVSAPGQFSNIDMEIPFIGLCDDMLYFSDTETTTLTIRVTEQSVVKSTRQKGYIGLKVIVGGTRKGMKIGTVKVGTQMGSSVTLAVDYIKIEFAGKVLLELDKYNEVYKVNDKDQLEKIRKYS